MLANLVIAALVTGLLIVAWLELGTEKGHHVPWRR
jgi:hypothetical protein